MWASPTPVWPFYELLKMAVQSSIPETLIFSNERNIAYSLLSEEENNTAPLSFVQ